MRIASNVGLGTYVPRTVWPIARAEREAGTARLPAATSRVTPRNKARDRDFGPGPLDCPVHAAG